MPRHTRRSTVLQSVSVVGNVCLRATCNQSVVALGSNLSVDILFVLGISYQIWIIQFSNSKNSRWSVFCDKQSYHNTNRLPLLAAAAAAYQEHSTNKFQRLVAEPLSTGYYFFVFLPFRICSVK